MRDAALALLKGVRATLGANAAVDAVVPISKITSSWAMALASPFIRLQVQSAVPFEGEGPAGSVMGGEHVVNVHCFSAEDNPVEVATIAARVRDALEDVDEAALDDADLWALQYRGTTYRTTGNDPVLQQAIVQFTATTTDA